MSKSEEGAVMRKSCSFSLVTYCVSGCFHQRDFCCIVVAVILGQNNLPILFVLV